MPAVAVAHAVPVGVYVQLVPTGKGSAVQGLSFGGGGGAGEQLIWIVPQLAAAAAHPAGGPVIRIKNCPFTAGLKVTVLNPFPQLLSSQTYGVVPIFVIVT